MFVGAFDVAAASCVDNVENRISSILSVRLSVTKVVAGVDGGVGASMFAPPRDEVTAACVKAMAVPCFGVQQQQQQ